MLEELQFGFPLLSVLIFLPLIGAILLWPQKDPDLLKKSALGIAVLELILASLLLLRFVPDSAAMQFSERLSWIPPLGISYHLAVDGISILFVGLTAFLTVMIVLYSWDSVGENLKLYLMSVLALEMTIMGIFVSIDLILFFVFWELMLIPSYFLIKIWGVGEEKEYAALKYVLYTLLGSVFMLVGFALLCLNYHDATNAYSFDFLELLTVPVPVSQQILIFWFIFMGLAFKAPVFPFHTWLPDALVQGPIGMSVVLAGVKLGTYGFLRFSFPLLPEASKDETVVMIVMALGLIAIVYGAIIAIIQADFRRLLVFSSISHLGFVVIGLFALNFQGIQGSLLQMINLGFTTAGLFFLAGFLYDRTGNTLVDQAGGLASKMPLFATFFLIIGMASIGLPGTNGFIGEFLILLGAFQAHWFYGLVAVSGVIFAASYFLWYYERAIFGPLGEKVPKVLHDLTQRESIIAVSLCVMIFWIGLYPSPFLNMINGSVQAVVDRLERGSVASIEFDKRLAMDAASQRIVVEE
ncbi:NADH-quinone oxidoreductase subunit M [Candidatus Nitronereus thalassa]|uniref:NADH-quinone oxidoreductase subunit M n=1 Tax=Candidatus Nitronereus thalassa TaxID=3020898 RepID=A0ABU3K7C2_9BACT|nr:NADH-quinone oxidoreductase subunit M [Candidatus Nitronereus thalassa]MDT7042262.1 NADH-quinone oxidoreductase subunit M [Candidatus Nitronereus thalassa]